jgi:flagellar P-ring protein precursor FlgI
LAFTSVLCISKDFLMPSIRTFLLILWLSLTTHAFAVEQVRLKDIGRFDGWRENLLVGVGVVTGLAGTGDSPRSKATRQSLSNLMSNFDLAVPSDQINSRNAAVVSIMASLPPVAHPGDRVDVVVTSLGDARSLAGGSLMMAPLKGPDGHIYALSQGPVSIGGYRYEQNANIVQKNHPTVGNIPSGAQIEEEISAMPKRRDGTIDYILTVPDYTTISRVASAINARIGSNKAIVKDSGAVQVALPQSDLETLSHFLAELESVTVVPDIQARVVINERTGIIVSGGRVRISPVTIAHGDIKVSIVTDYMVSQPTRLIQPNNANIRTQVTPTTRINVDEETGGVLELSGQATVAELVRSLNRMKASTRDIIAILQGIKAAGALYADLIIQ